MIKKLHWLFPCVAALAGWAVGEWFQPEMPADTAQRPVADEKTSRTSKASVEWSQVSTGEKCTAPGETPTAEESIREVNLQRLWRAGDNKATLEAFLDYAHQNPARALDLAMRLEGPEAWRMAMDLVLSLPPHLGPVALDVLKRHPQFLKACPVLDAVFFLCAKSDPERAWAAAHAPGVKFTHDAIRAITRGVAVTNPIKGIELLRQVANPGLRRNYIWDVLQSWQKKNQREMLTWLKKQPDFDALAEQVQWAELTFHSAEEFLAMAEMVPMSVLEGAISRSSFGRANTKDGGWPLRTDWISAVKDEKRRSALYASAARSLMEVDPEQALSMLPNVTNASLRSGITSLVAAYRAAESPQQGFAFADSLSDAKAREMAQQSVLQTWSKNDPAAAGAYLLEQGDKSAGQILTYSIANEWAKIDPAGAAASSLQRMTAGDSLQASSLFETVMKKWVQDDVYDASNWVKDLPAGGARDHAVSSLAKNSSGTEPEGALGWALTISDDSLRQAAMVQCLSNWQSRDRAGAKAWLEQSSLDAATRANLSQLAERTPPTSYRSSGGGTNSSTGKIVIY